MLHSALINVMVKAARRAGRNLKRDLGEIEHLQVSQKGPANFVSLADKRAEEMLYTDLSKARPGYGFLGEEGGKGAFLNDQRLRVAGRRKLNECVIACGLPHIGRGDHELGLKEMAALQDKIAGFRRFGAAALDLAFVAAGRLDGYWERNLQAWDIAAGQIVVREAGGIVSGMTGNDDALGSGHVICGNEF